MKLSGLIAIFLVFVCHSFGQQRDPENLYAANSGYVHFVSDAPLELIEATSNELKGLIDTKKQTFAFTIPTRSFQGFNSPLQQEHFYENYIEAHIYPAASFEGRIIEDVDLLSRGRHRVRAKGILNIHGVAQERVIHVNITTGEGKISASATFDVILKDHDITIPKMVYQKISEKITVTVELEFLPME